MGGRLQSSADEAIRAGIARRRLLRLVYLGKARVVEPHDYGIHRGVVKLLAYQVGGESGGPLPNWRWFEVERLEEVEVLRRSFAGGRGGEVGKHHEWDEVFARVEAA